MNGERVSYDNRPRRSTFKETFDKLDLVRTTDPFATGVEKRVIFGIARIMQTGWYKQVHVKTPASHAIKALLVSRALLVKIKRDIENQIRGLLKNLGLVIGRAKMMVFCARTEELIQDRPEIAIAVRPLLEARKTIEQQIAGLDRKVMKLARSDSQVRTFMTKEVAA